MHWSYKSYIQRPKTILGIPTPRRSLPCTSRLVSLARDRAHGILGRALNAGVRNDPVLVVANRGLGDGADILGPSLQHVGVVGGQNGSRGAYNGAERIVELLRLGLVDGRLQRRAGSRFGRRQSRHVWVLVEVVVVVSRRSYNRTLLLLACGCSWGRRGEAAYCLAVNVEINLRVIGRENAVGGSDDWAGSHGVWWAACWLDMCRCAESSGCKGFVTRNKVSSSRRTRLNLPTSPDLWLSSCE